MNTISSESNHYAGVLLCYHDTETDRPEMFIKTYKSLCGFKNNKEKRIRMISNDFKFLSTEKHLLFLRNTVTCLAISKYAGMLCSELFARAFTNITSPVAPTNEPSRLNNKYIFVPQETSKIH